jgi:dipeptide transport system ATP-binding protein
MQDLLKVQNITKSYKVRTGSLRSKYKQVIDNVSFVVGGSKIVAVVGESGSGKSTLARQLVALEKPDSGEIFLKGKSLEECSTVYQKIRMIFQNPMDSLNPRKRIYEQMEEPLRNFQQLAEKERKDKILSTLQRVGLDHSHATYYPHMFSGGQRQRIAIARAIILDPDIVIADEPVSALDVSVQSQILNLILELKQESSMSWVFITHDIGVVKAVADDIIVMYSGRVMEKGPAAEVLEAPLHPYTRSLLDSVPVIDELNGIRGIKGNCASTESAGDESLQQGCVYHKGCHNADDLCRSRQPHEAMLGVRSVACFHPLQG